MLQSTTFLMMKKIKNFIFLLAILTISFALKAQSNPDFDDVTVELTDNGVRLCWTAIDDASYYKIFERHGDHSYYFVDSTSMTCFNNASYHPTKDNCYYVTAVMEDGQEIISNEVCIGMQALNFAVIDIHGESFELFEKLDSGQFVFIDFFNYSCYNCREAIPYIVESYYRYGCNNGDVFYVEINSTNGDEMCLRWCEEFGVEFPTISTDGGSAKFSSLYHIDAAPHFILIAPDHSVVLDGGSSGFYVHNLQSIIDAFEPLGIRVMDCNESTNETSADNDYLYPNPANNFINLSTEVSNEIRIYNSTGQLMGTYIADAPQTTIPTNHYPDGIYLIQINGKTTGRFLVKH